MTGRATTLEKLGRALPSDPPSDRTCEGCGRRLRRGNDTGHCWHCNARFQKPASETAKKLRKCMSCTSEFVSEGPHNRLCNTCRAKGSSEDWMGGGSISTGSMRRGAK